MASSKTTAFGAATKMDTHQEQDNPGMYNIPQHSHFPQEATPFDYETIAQSLKNFQHDPPTPRAASPSGPGLESQPVLLTYNFPEEYSQRTQALQLPHFSPNRNIHFPEEDEQEPLHLLQ